MSLKTKALRIYAGFKQKALSRDTKSAIKDQKQIFLKLVESAQFTQFGKDHGYDKIRNISDYQNQVPIRDYEQIRPYISKIIEGGRDVLWKGIPRYLAKTSGTTSGIKYIPITDSSISNHIDSARTALFNILWLKKDFSVFDGRVIFLSGSPELSRTGGILTGRLSGIVNHEIPFWLKKNQLPTYPTNCIDDWESKLDRIITETVREDLRLISGIPPWVQMYFEKLLEITGKSTILELYPHFSIFMFGGVNYDPYRMSLQKLIGGTVDEIELYPASEGFFAFQDNPVNEGLLLITNSGIYYEFVPKEEIFSENPSRLTLDQVELDRDYAMIVSSNAGLWAYNIGDTIKFVSLDPYRIIVTGRIKHFISAFGEHVIGKEVEEAMKQTTEKMSVTVIEFTVAPQVNPSDEGIPYHEWFVEFESVPDDMKALARELDKSLVEQNIYYRDLIEGGILQPLKITALKKNAFRDYMKSLGKLGGQNKVPRLANDREIADKLQSFSLSRVND